MVPPDDNSFEIARRLDKYGSGKGPPRVPREAAPAVNPVPKTRKGGSRWIRRLFWLLVLMIAVYWWFSSRQEPNPSQSRSGAIQNQGQIPPSNPPQTIPALHGEGTVPAFTVQVPGHSDAAPQAQEPSKTEKK